MPYAPSVQDMSAQYRAQFGAQNAQNIMQTGDVLGQQLAGYQQRQDQNKTLLAQAKATEAFIKSQPDLYGGQGVVDQITAIDPKESPMARYARLAQYTKDAMGGQQLAQEKQKTAQLAQLTQQQGYLLKESQSKKAEEDALNQKLDMLNKLGSQDPTMQQNPLLKLRAMGVTVTPDMASKLQGDMIASDSRMDVANVRSAYERQLAGARSDTAQAQADLANSKQNDKLAAQGFDETAKLRGEFSANPNTKNFDTVDSFYKTGLKQAQQASPAGDIGLLYSVMKVFDPTSSVREGERADATKSGSIPQTIVNTYNHLIEGGGSLLPAQRADFLKSMGDAAQVHHDKVVGTATQYAKIARKRGLDPEDVIDPSYFDWTPAATPSAPAAPSSNLNALLSKYPPRK